MKSKRVLCVFAVICLCNSAMAVVTYENSQLMSFVDVGWGAPGSALISKTDQGALGVDFSVTLGTADYGKLPAGNTSLLNWSGETDFYLKIELLSASGASESIELNPFIQAGSGWLFTEAKDGVVLAVGQSYVQHWDISGIADLGNIKTYGFQLFTAGNVTTPEAMSATVRVTPAYEIPEPATVSLLCLGIAGLLSKKRNT